MKTYKDLCELIVETKGNPSDQQMLNAGFTMENLIWIAGQNVNKEKLVTKANDYLSQIEIMYFILTDEWIKQGFDRIGLKDYLINQIPGHMDRDARSYFLMYVDKIVDYGLKYEHVSKDQFAYWLSDMIPDLEVGEAAMFIADSSLTNELQYVKRETYRELVET
jgi:hypothetical protein